MRDAVVLMSAVVPTTGHVDLIRYARNLPGVGRVFVILGHRKNEPVSPQKRLFALREHCNTPGVPVVFKPMLEDGAPEKVGDLTKFWGWWGEAVNERLPEPWEGRDTPYLVLSEGWGKTLADSMGCVFIPYDIPRVLNPVKGTRVRGDLWGEWLNIVPEFRQFLNTRITVFGQESVGKTTVSTMLGKLDGFFSTPEWARPYLECVGAELDEQKMFNIEVGQYGQQKLVRNTPPAPVTVQDTDLYSTLGYYNISPYTPSQNLLRWAWEEHSDMYYVMPDDVPFVPDQLRYGGGVRETSTQFWVDLLEDHGLPYVFVPSGSVEEKVDFIQNHARALFEKKNRDIAQVVRAYKD